MSGLVESDLFKSNHTHNDLMLGRPTDFFIDYVPLSLRGQSLDSKSRGASTPCRGACPELIEGIPTSGTIFFSPKVIFSEMLPFQIFISLCTAVPFFSLKTYDI
jgi:hypothetical protein